jgi:hypothetical protein
VSTNTSFKSSLPADSSRPWYRAWWGVVYLTLLGIVSAAMLLILLLMPSHDWDKFLALMIPGVVLDGLLAVPIAVAVFRRRFWRLRRVPVADWIVGLILLAPCLYLAWALAFGACMLLSDLTPGVFRNP